MRSYILSGRLSRFICNITQLFTVKPSSHLPAEKKKEDKVKTSESDFNERKFCSFLRKWFPK